MGFQQHARTKVKKVVETPEFDHYLNLEIVEKRKERLRGIKRASKQDPVKPQTSQVPSPKQRHRRRRGRGGKSRSPSNKSSRSPSQSETSSVLDLRETMTSDVMGE